MTTPKQNISNFPPHGRGGGEGFRLIGFPKEFERNFFDLFDRRYYSILLVTWVLLYALVFFMTSRDWHLSEKDKEKIKQTYIQRFYAELAAPEQAEATEGEGAGAGFSTSEEEQPKEELSESSQKLVGESASERVQRRRAGAGVRKRQRAAMEQEAAGYGVLAALTASGSGGSGSGAYADILGESGGAGSGLANAGELVAGAAAIQTATRSGQRSRIAKGGGFGNDVGDTGIDELISGVGVSEGESVSRKGSIKLAGGTKISGAGSGSSQRNPETIDAVINQNKASVEYCYQSQLKVDPNLRGEIVISFDILPNGRVGAVKIIQSTLNNRRVEQCVQRAIRRWSNFPKLEDQRSTVTIKTKFVFG